jgi:hypothetical protein
MAVTRMSRSSIGNFAKANVLSGPDGAVVSATTGSPSLSSGVTIGGKNYDLYTFDGAGSMTFSKEGYVDLAVIGGGGGAASGSFNRTASGGGGGVLVASTFASAETVTVAVGAGGAGGGLDRAGRGGVSSFGSVMKINGGAGGWASNAGAIIFGDAGAGGGEGGVYIYDSGSAKPRGSGAGSTIFATNLYDGRPVDITGASVTYGESKASGTGDGGNNTGDGGGCSASSAGGSGRVIVRVEV